MDFDGFVLHGNISARIYLGSANSLIKHICDDSQKSALNSEDKQLDTQVFVPNTMNSASSYFAKGLYENSVSLEQSSRLGLGKKERAGETCSTFFMNIEGGSYKEWLLLLIATGKTGLVATVDAETALPNWQEPVAGVGTKDTCACTSEHIGHPMTLVVNAQITCGSSNGIGGGTIAPTVFDAHEFGTRKGRSGVTREEGVLLAGVGTTFLNCVLDGVGYARHKQIGCSGGKEAVAEVVT